LIREVQSNQRWKSVGKHVEVFRILNSLQACLPSLYGLKLDINRESIVTGLNGASVSEW